MDEWRECLGMGFGIERMFVLGHKSQLVPLAWGKLKERTMRLIPDRIGRFITNRASVGYLLVSVVVKE